MTYMRAGDEIREIKFEKVVVHPIRPKATQARDRKYCSQEAEKRLREVIRGMDDAERMIVLDEIGRIYGARKAE